MIRSGKWFRDHDGSRSRGSARCYELRAIPGRLPRVLHLRRDRCRARFPLDCQFRCRRPQVDSSPPAVVAYPPRRPVRN